MHNPLLLMDAFRQEGLNNDFLQIVAIILENLNKEDDSAYLVSIPILIQKHIFKANYA